MGVIMFEKLSDLKEKSEYQKVLSDYSNNYGFNLGTNSLTSKNKQDKFDNIVNKELNMKKR